VCGPQQACVGRACHSPICVAKARMWDFLDRPKGLDVSALAPRGVGVDGLRVAVAGVRAWATSACPKPQRVGDRTGTVSSVTAGLTPTRNR